MSTTWNVVYSEICSVLLEPVPPGLQLGLLTVPQFLNYAGEVMVDLLSQGAFIKRIFIQQMFAGTSMYAESDQMTHLESVVAGGQHLDRTSDFFLDNSMPRWGRVSLQPTMFSEGNLPVQQLNLAPTPNLTGDELTIAAGQGGYGQISGTMNPMDFDIVASIPTPAGYGTFQDFGGNPFVEVIGPSFGVIGTFVPSDGNVEMFASALPSNIMDLMLENNVELIPDSFIPYLKYGILAKVFGADGELKNPLKAQYCQARWQEGISLSQAVMGGEIRDNP